jgi:4-hydroxybenzoate polyprenyltransferase
MVKRAISFLDLIRFEHTIFALPFAYLGMVLAADGWPGWWKFTWITVAMAAARTAGMSLNRLIDRHIDARNPRTAQRPIQAGRISVQTTVVGALVSLVVLGVAAWLLNPVAFLLFPGALVFLVGYPYTKRFTWLSHFWLGFTDGLAPAGAWVAITGTFWRPEDLLAWLLLALWHCRRPAAGAGVPPADRAAAGRGGCVVWPRLAVLAGAGRHRRALCVGALAGAARRPLAAQPGLFQH